MTLNGITNIYSNVKSTSYDVGVVDDMLSQLNVVVEENGNKKEETMLLSMVCSALKSYCNSSIEAYSDDITNIVIKLENMYTINGLLPAIIEL